MNDSRIPDPAALLREAITGEARALPWAVPDAAALAAAFPELSIHELVGQGGMAAVYRATQSRLGRQVGLKVMRQDLAGQPQFVERFVREARALAALANPHVLAIHDFGERAGFCYLVTEFVDGANLRELMRLGQMSASEVLRIVPQICAGLHFAHQHGVVHRDIKPENVLVDRQGLVKLADFGLAKLVGEQGPALTASQSVFGTPHYMAPEQWHGSGAVDHRADIYSLGVVLYELLTGRLPVGTYAPASQQPGVPPGIDQVVQRSLQQEPERRYQSARDVQRDVEQQGRAAAAAPRKASATKGPTRSVLGLLVAAVATLLVGALVVGAFILWQSKLLMTTQFMEVDARQVTRALENVRAVLMSGKAWTEALPSLQPMSLAGLLPPLQRIAVVLLFGAGAAGFAFALVRAARARSFDTAVPRWQHTAAGFLVWLPVFALVVSPLVMLAEHYANASNGIVPVLVIVVVMGLAFLLCVLLHRAGAGREQKVRALRPRGWRAAAAALGFIVISCGLIALAAPAPKEQPTVRLMVPAHELVGLSRSAVLDRMGAPQSCSVKDGVMFWGYRSLDGQVHEQALRLQRGKVVGAEAEPLLPVPLPTKSPYLGQSQQEVVRELGLPSEVLPGVNGLSIVRFSPTLSVLVDGDGIVVQVQG